MKYAIRYYTKTGNTKKLADAISDVLDIQAFDIKEEITEDVDTLFLGTSIYGDAIDPAVIKFFDNLKVNINKIILFGTSGTMKSAYDDIASLCLVHDIQLDEKEFHCLGCFVGMNMDRPNSKDVENIKSFVKDVINE